MWYYRLTRNRKKHTVYFSSFSGQYSDSPRAVSEALHKLAPDIEQVWQHNGIAEMPEYITKVYTPSECRKAMAQASAWVLTNTYPWKAKGILSVAVWHGERGFKKVAYAAIEDMREKYYRFSKRLSWDNVDLFTIGSDFGIRLAQEAFHYYGDIMYDGVPRNDKLINEKYDGEYANSIRTKLGIPLDTKLLLYAPTFRDKSKTKQSIDVELQEIMNILQRNGEKWLCLLRSHVASKGLEVIGDYDYLDVSGIGDMADLLLISDCLITDYSSSAGDFILTDRPCILVHFDLDDYKNNSRSLWFDPTETGFLIAKNPEELRNIFLNIYSYDHKEINQKVCSFYGVKETGKSSDLVAKRIMSWIYNNK